MDKWSAVSLRFTHALFLKLLAFRVVVVVLLVDLPSSSQATVAGLKFSARTTLEVREWPQGLPDFAHFYDEMWNGKSRQDRAQEYAKVKLQRYSFPRPFAISKLPTHDITMQSVADDDGEFRMYQGVWRLQPLPGCIPEGRGLSAMRLTYAVEGTLAS